MLRSYGNIEERKLGIYSGVINAKTRDVPIDVLKMVAEISSYK